MVQSLCQLKRWRRSFESSVTMASKSFSGFHSAILTCLISINSFLQMKPTLAETSRSKTTRSPSWCVRMKIVVWGQKRKRITWEAIGLSNCSWNGTTLWDSSSSMDSTRLKARSTSSWSGLTDPRKRAGF